MGLSLRGTTSGYVEINAPAVAGDNSLTLPTTAGTIRITNPSGVDGDYTVAAGATISGSENTVIVSTADASSTALRLRSDGGGTNGGHLEGEGPRISFDAKRGNDGGNGSAAYIEQKAIGDLGASYPVDLAFGVRRFGSSFEALRIASTGNIGIGTTIPTSKLQIEGTVRSGEGYTVYPPSDSNYAFATRNSANDQWTAFIEANGKATFAGNVVLSTAGTGIDFSATSGTGTSELLDDYEEGTWTPVIKSGTNTISYSGGNQYFRYTKIGCLVTVTFALNASTTSGTTGGGFKIEGLPFASRNLLNLRTIGTHVCYYGSGLRASQWPNFIHIGSNNSYVDIYTKTASSSNYDRDTVASVGANTYFFWQVTYETES